MANAVQSQVDAVLASSPSYDFRSTVDTARWTKAVYIVDSTNDSMTVPNSVTAGNITIRAGGQFYPFRVKAAITASGYDVIYCY